MCGRYVLLKRDVNELMKKLHLEALLQLVAGESRYNVAPSQLVVTVRQGETPTGLQPAKMRWGWQIPGEAPGKSFFVINARGETIRQRPAFREAFNSRRCLLAASGFYEWRRSGPAPEPHLIQMADEAPFFMAGLWQPGADGEDRCIVITTTPNALMENLHDRMPAILSPDAALQWVTLGSEKSDTVKALLAPFPAERMKARPVSTFVNSAKNEGEGCVASPAALPTPAERPANPSAQLGFDF